MEEYQHINNEIVNTFRTWFIDLTCSVLFCLFFMLTYINKTYSINIYSFDIYGYVLTVLLIMYLSYNKYTKLINTQYLRG